MNIDRMDIKTHAGDGVPVTVFYTDTTTKGVVILVPGFAEPALIYTEFAKHLTKAGYACVALDQIGRPEALRKKPDYACALEDIGSIASAVGRKAPQLPLILYAHSMGANIAVNYLLRRGQGDFSCAILESPWLELRKKVGWWKALFCKVVSRLRPGAVVRLHLTDLKEDFGYQGAGIGANSLDQISMRLFSDLYDGGRFALSNAASLRTPTYIAYAEKEEIVSNEAIGKFHRASGENVRLKRYDGMKRLQISIIRSP